jgi:hypothetical protein
LLKIYLLDLLTETLRPMVEINPLSEPRTFDNWFFEMDRLPKEFTDQFKELYKMCIASPRVRDRTNTWIKIMQETLHSKESKPPFSSHIRKIQSVSNSPFPPASSSG